MARTTCIECRAKLPADRFEVAEEETRTNTSRGLAMATRLSGDRCLRCSEPRAKSSHEAAMLSGDSCRPEGQSHGLSKTRS